MTRNLYRCLPLSVLLFVAAAVAQTPTQTPQQNYPNESERTAPQAQQQPPQPTTPNQQAYPEENPMTPTTNASPQTPSQPRALSPDDALKNQLQRTLAANPRLSDVQPVVAGGQVTLTGTVATEADRADAKRAIEQVSGVNKVVDELTIGTTSHTPPGGNASEGAATSVPQSDVYGKGSSAQGAARGCECPKGQANGKYPGTDEPCACSGTTTHNGESLPKNPKTNAQPAPVPPKAE